MNANTTSLLQMYEAELLRYIDAPDEVHLLRGYELGRAAAETGIGLLQLSDAHHRGLDKAVAQPSTTGTHGSELGRRIRRSAEFFAEGLASFEMVYHGYRAQIEILEEQETRLIAAREDADRANLAKSQFVSHMSHELRTPLNVILGFGQLLEMDDLTREQHETVGQIRNAGIHLLALINEVLDTARIESGHLDLRMTAVPVADVVKETLDLTSALAKTRGLRLHAEPTGCHVLADRQRLKQVLLNLVSNAIKYNRENGSVEISCRAYPNHLTRIAVTDTGPGIAESAIERLFMPFERLEAGRSGIEGTGLGLAMAKGLAVAMGGTIGVHSVEGEGSTFWIELGETFTPAAPTEALSDTGLPGDAVVRDRTSPRTILCVDDHQANVDLMRRVLGRIPSTTLLVAIQGAEGVALAQQHRPDLVLLDLNLPDISGEDVLRQLQNDARTSTIPVVMVSADAMPARVEHLIASGASAYLTKPFDVMLLLDVVNDAITKSRRACS